MDHKLLYKDLGLILRKEEITYSLSVQWGRWSGNTRPLGGHWFGGPAPPTEGRDAALHWRRRKVAASQQGNPCMQSETPSETKAYSQESPSRGERLLAQAFVACNTRATLRQRCLVELFTSLRNNFNPTFQLHVGNLHQNLKCN